MPTSQPLVPTGGEYGSRQENVAAMRQGGIPLAPTQGGAPGPGPMVATPGGAVPADATGIMDPLDLLSSTSPGDFPFATEPSPDSQPATEPDSVLAALGASAQSSFAQAVIARLIGA